MGIFDGFKKLVGSADEQPAATPAIPKKKILIVEDEPQLAGALETKCKLEGYEVIRAENGDIGLKKAVEVKPNMILLDLMMPVMDGKTMLTKLREIPEIKDLPVIVLTNAGNIENMHETEMFLNAVDFLVKSNVSLEEIVAKIKEQIG